MPADAITHRSRQSLAVSDRHGKWCLSEQPLEFAEVARPVGAPELVNLRRHDVHSHAAAHLPPRIEESDARPGCLESTGRKMAPRRCARVSSAMACARARRDRRRRRPRVPARNPCRRARSRIPADRQGRCSTTAVHPCRFRPSLGRCWHARSYRPPHWSARVCGAHQCVQQARFADIQSFEKRELRQLVA